MIGWEEFKEEKYRKYQKAKSDGKIDQDIISLLDVINSNDRFVTISSCSGRIGVLDTPKAGDKLNSKFLAKWHHHVDPQEVVEVVKKGRRTTWLIVNSPILHVACKDLQSAGELMDIANNNGFARSGMISLKKNIVEISSHERMETPTSSREVRLLEEELLKVVVSFANGKLSRSKEKLSNLERALKELF